MDEGNYELLDSFAFGSTWLLWRAWHREAVADALVTVDMLAERERELLGRAERAEVGEAAQRVRSEDAEAARRSAEEETAEAHFLVEHLERDIKARDADYEAAITSVLKAERERDDFRQEAALASEHLGIEQERAERLARENTELRSTVAALRDENNRLKAECYASDDARLKAELEQSRTMFSNLMMSVRNVRGYVQDEFNGWLDEGEND